METVIHHKTDVCRLLRKIYWKKCPFKKKVVHSGTFPGLFASLEHHFCPSLVCTGTLPPVPSSLLTAASLFSHKHVLITESLQPGRCLLWLTYARIWTQNMRVKGRNLGLRLHFTDSAIIILMSPASSGTIEGEKCANINMPLKERWLGVHRTQVLLTQSWSRSNSPSPLGSPLFISHMARPPVLLTQDTGRDAEKTIWGHEHGTSMGKIILKVPSWQWWKAHPG